MFIKKLLIYLILSYSLFNTFIVYFYLILMFTLLYSLLYSIVYFKLFNTLLSVIAFFEFLVLYFYCSYILIVNII
ncbi:hypothetical protein RIR_jg24644.t1 [Rhizophagus irregularis DAOM 181602=DAOM 197198]|nr:hypothetical protein RIR_jg24644.t1 [Rhizophagus irregularis DAOM 181602=DAOM 197198]